MGILDRFFGREPVADMPDMAQALQDDPLRNVMAQALQEARDKAKAENRQPNLSDYYLIARQMLQKSELPELKALANDPTRMNNALADLSGQDLSGYMISNAHPPVGDPSRSPSPAEDFMDLDNDNTINNFYAQVRVNGETNLDHITIRPASSFNQIKREGVTVTNAIFDGLEAGQTVELGAGTYTNIQFTGMNGGIINMHENAQANRVTIEGTVAELNLGRNSELKNLQAEKASIVEISAEELVRIDGAIFRNTTVSMASKMNAGITLRNVSFIVSNLPGIELTDAHLSNVTFDNCNTTDIGFAGAVLSNVQFKNVTDYGSLVAALKTANNIAGTTINGQPVNSFADLSKLEALASIDPQQLKHIGTTLHNAADSIRPMNIPIDEVARWASTGISGGVHTDLSTALDAGLKAQDPNLPNHAEKGEGYSLNQGNF